MGIGLSRDAIEQEYAERIRLNAALQPVALEWAGAMLSPVGLAAMVLDLEKALGTMDAGSVEYDLYTAAIERLTAEGSASQAEDLFAMYKARLRSVV